MATSKTIYVKSKVLNYYGLAGFHYEYNKVYSNNSEVAATGSIVQTGNVYFETRNSIKNELITNQEYQEATGDYSCDIGGLVDLMTEKSEKNSDGRACDSISNGEFKRATSVAFFSGMVAGLILPLVVSLCVN